MAFGRKKKKKISYASGILFSYNFPEHVLCWLLLLQQFDVVLPGWPSAVLCDRSQPICYCRHRAVILPASDLALSINCDLSVFSAELLKTN